MLIMLIMTGIITDLLTPENNKFLVWRSELVVFVLWLVMLGRFKGCRKVAATK